MPWLGILITRPKLLLSSATRVRKVKKETEEPRYMILMAIFITCTKLFLFSTTRINQVRKVIEEQE